jgi:hypothetical protein
VSLIRRITEHDPYQPKGGYASYNEWNIRPIPAPSLPPARPATANGDTMGPTNPLQIPSPFDHGLVTVKVTRHQPTKSSSDSGSSDSIRNTSINNTSSDLMISSPTIFVKHTPPVSRNQIDENDEFVLWYTLDTLWPQTCPLDDSLPTDGQYQSWRFKVTDLPLMIRFDGHQTPSLIHDIDGADHRSTVSVAVPTNTKTKSSAASTPSLPHTAPPSSINSHTGAVGGYYLVINRGRDCDAYNRGNMPGPSERLNRRFMIWRIQPISTIEMISLNSSLGTSVDHTSPCMYQCADGSFITEPGNIGLQNQLLSRGWITSLHDWSWFHSLPSSVVTIPLASRVTTSNLSSPASTTSSSTSSSSMEDGKGITEAGNRSAPSLSCLNIWHGRGISNGIGKSGAAHPCHILVSSSSTSTSTIMATASNNNNSALLSLCIRPRYNWFDRLPGSTYFQQSPIHDPNNIALAPLVPYLRVSILLRLIVDYIMAPAAVVTCNDHIRLDQFHAGYLLPFD